MFNIEQMVTKKLELIQYWGDAVKVQQSHCKVCIYNSFINFVK